VDVVTDWFAGPRRIAIAEISCKKGPKYLTITERVFGACQMSCLSRNRR
jgi:hypothetical protein